MSERQELIEKIEDILRSGQFDCHGVDIICASIKQMAESIADAIIQRKNRKVIRGWVHKDVTLRDMAKWTPSDTNGPYIVTEYIQEVCKTKREAIKNFGESIKEVKIEVSFL